MDSRREDGGGEFFWSVLRGDLAETQPRVASVPLTEQEAWNQALKGYSFPENFSIGILDFWDWTEIRQYPPQVSLEQYQTWKSQSREELLRQVEGLEVLAPDILWEEVFFFLTRGWSPSDTRLKEKWNRWKQWENLLEPTKELLQLLYPNPTPRTFAEASPPHPLEEICLRFDTWAGLPETPFWLANQVGMYLAPTTQDPDISFYNRWYHYVRISQKQHPAVMNLETVVFLSSGAFQEFLQKEHPTLSIPYDRRTDFVMETYYYW